MMTSSSFSKAKFLVITFTLIFGLIITISCKKEEVYEATVIVTQDVIEGEDFKVAGAQVILSADPNNEHIGYVNPQDKITKDTSITNAAGQVTFRNANQCILNAKVTYTTENDIVLKGSGLVIFREEEDALSETKIKLK